MKYFIGSFLIAVALATSLPCRADDRSTAKEKKTAKSSASTQKQSAQSNHQAHAVQATHPAGTAFCRRGDYYCIRAAASPWWPNAPGD